MDGVLNQWQRDARLVNRYLNETLERQNVSHTVLKKAMRYALLDGKRLRPFLLMETAKLFGISPQKSLQTAAALECIHCYSLVHDDLPAMDNDELRRGKPTVHKKFGDATAILVGDALLTLAFELLADKKTHPDPAVRAELSLMLAKAASPRGMVGGQMLDLSAKKLSKKQLLEMHAFKTGALIRCAVEMGAVLGGARLGERRALSKFGEHLGAIYQLADDLSDVAKDVKKGRPNAASMFGIEHVQQMIKEHQRNALHALKSYGDSAKTLRETICFLVASN